MQKMMRRIELEIAFLNQDGVTIDLEKYVSTGERNGLAISFNVVKVLNDSPNTSTVMIKNLAPAFRRKLMRNVTRTAVRLFAGYDGEPRTVLAVGDVLKAWPERVGTENQLTITFLDGITAILQSNSYHAYPPGMPIKNILLDLAKDFSRTNDVQVDPTKIEVDGVIGLRGLTVSGKTSTILADLSRQFSFTWSIQTGVFQAYRDKTVGAETSRRVYSISIADNNLFKATPELGEKYMQQIGMKIDAVLNSKIRPGDVVNLKSSVYPEYSGRYIAHNINYTGDTFGPDWVMSIESKQAANQL